MSSVNPPVVTGDEHELQLALQALPLPILLKTLAGLTDKERELSRQLREAEANANRVEAVVLDKMVQEDTPSMTVEYDDGKRMKFSISSRTYPKMTNGSQAAAYALERYAARLRAEGRGEEADFILDMLTIKGQSLVPLLGEWLMNDEPLPPEFEGAIEPSMRMSLSKTKATSRSR